jgi:hypothetical protein
VTARAKINAAFAAAALLALAFNYALHLGFPEIFTSALYVLLAWVAPSPGRVADRRVQAPAEVDPEITDRLDVE